MLKNKRFVKIMSVVVLAFFLAVSILSVLPALRASAETAQEKLDNSIKKQEQIKEQIHESEKKKEDSIAAKEIIDREVSQLQGSIDVLNSDIAKSNQKLAKKEEELKAAQEECDKQYASYCERAEILLEKSSISYLEIILKADSFEDFLTRAALVHEIAEYDNNRLKELQEYAEQVEVIKNEVKKENENLVALKSKADSQMSTLKSRQAESQAIIDNLTGNIAEFEAALEAQERAEAAARDEIRRLAAQSTVSAVPYTGGAFAWPSTSSAITSPYGTRVHPVTGKTRTHAGIDIGAPHGTNVFAAADGVVLVSGWNTGGYGNYVVIDHGGGLTTLYAHNSSLLVSSGQRVTRGQVIAKCGSTGLSTGPHIHFEVLKNGGHTNPMAYF